MIQFIANKNNKLIPFALSKSLCSFQRPLSEAMNWYQMYNMKNQKEACILGAGGGFHIRYLSLKHPDMNIHVYDFNQELLENMEIQFKNNSRIKFFYLDTLNRLNDIHQLQKYIFEKMPVVMPFRPGWQNDDEMFSKLLLKITQRQASLLKENWGQNAVGIQFDWNQLSEEHYFLTLKNLLRASDALSSFDSKVLHVFDEIIK